MSAQAPGLSPLRAAIMVGGQGSRMGGPKATLRLPDGSSLLHRVLQATSACELPTVLVGGGSVPAEAQGLTRLADTPGAQGPLGGILAALEHDRDSGWLVLACDLPAIDERAIQWLLAQRRPDRAVVIPRLEGAGLEPLFAVYEPDARSLIEHQTTHERWAVRELHALPGVATPTVPDALRPSWTNLNTPSEFARFVEVADLGL